MRIRLSVFHVALATAVLTGGATEGIAATPQGRVGLAARQLVRAEMVAATADGKLTEKERQYILVLAKRAFGEEELGRVEASLDGLVVRRQIGVVHATDTSIAGPTLAQPGNNADQHSTSQVTQTSMVEPSPTLADPPPPGAGTATKDGGSPFHEEAVTSDETTVYDDATILYEDGQQAFGNLRAAYDHGLQDFTLSSSVDAFKGPLDLDNQNGNFGFQFGVNGAIPLSEPLGIGVQAGTSAILSDLHGTQFTGSRIRTQNFTTIGLFQRNSCRAPKLSWGFAYDWLHDEYYSSMVFSQWRVKLGYQLTPQSELGIWACIPDQGDTAVVGSPQIGFTTERFRPISQGNLYYSRCWESGARTTMWIGIADEPGEFIFGADARVPLSPRTSLVGNFNYVLPSSGGITGQDEEMWNVSVGLELTLGPCHNHCAINRFAPFFPLANNGIMGIRRF
ncbi:MAG: DUF4148 domain-containing protein [Candidatus Nealsonbacteria bacterium]|nr:DUF4148 domain-containing protein [Candidatus Nealsonbacteria bacterium]